MMLDLAITGGTLVVPGSGLFEADVGVVGEQIAAIASPGTLPAAANSIDASGLIVTPGIIDPHAHFGAFTSREQDVEAETRAALLGGITTVGWFFHESGSYLDALPRIADIISSHASVDMFPHPILTTEEHLEEVRQCSEQHGVNSFKAYMASEYFSTADDDFLYRLFEQAAVLPGTVICLHAENDVIVKAKTARAQKSNSTGTLRDWSDARPSYAEEEAITRAAYLASLTDAEIYIVHMNSWREVECVRRLKASGHRIFSETVTHYLALTVDHELGVLVKRDPPLREAADLEALWLGVADGTIDTLGTDNVVGSIETNRAQDGIFRARLGFTTLGTHLPVCLEEGYHRRNIELERIVRAMTMRPAQIFGLYPQKGNIAIGSDADLTVIDLHRAQEVDVATLETWSDFSPWQGKRLRGWPIYTILRGQLAMAEGEIRARPGVGRYLVRGPMRQPSLDSTLASGGRS